ncbi:MAG: response regulator [Verrucomicrobiota bacterium]
MHFLIAEDNPVNAAVLQRLLHRLSHSWETVENGQLAVDKVRDGGSYDAILMDLQMPVLDGLEAAKVILAEASSPPPIIACTANTFDTDRRAAAEAGMVEFLAKPVKLGVLEQALANVAQASSGPSLEEADTDDGTIDWEHFEMMMDDGDEEMLEIFEDFCQSVREWVGQLDQFREAEDWTSFAELAHQLKGSLSTFGVSGLAGEVGSLERAIKDGQPFEVTAPWASATLQKFAEVETKLRENLGK